MSSRTGSFDHERIEKRGEQWGVEKSGLCICAQKRKSKPLADTAIFVCDMRRFDCLMSS